MEKIKKPSKLAMILAGTAIALASASGCAKKKVQGAGSPKPVYNGAGSSIKDYLTIESVLSANDDMINKIRMVREKELNDNYFTYGDLRKEVEAFKARKGLPESYDVETFLQEAEAYEQKRLDAGEEFDASAYLTEIGFR